MGCTTEECTEKHQRNIWLYHPEHLAAAEHSINHGHWTQLGNMMTSVKLPHYTTRIICKAIKIVLHNNFN
jgi:hypothetical protein